MFGHNKGLKLFSQGMGGMPGQTAMGMPPKQLNLVPSEGFTGNGMATIGSDNSFSVIAHLPPVHTVSPYAPAVYAAYLVDAKGKNGFYAGTLRAAGNGMFQANFRSPVPLVHYDKVVISLESPQSITQSPQGPIVMKVKEGFFGGLGPVKKVGGDMWGKVKGFVGSRIGGKGETEQIQPGTGQSAQSAMQQPVMQPPVQQPVQQYNPYISNPYTVQQRNYPQQGYQQRAGQQGINYGSPQQGGYQQANQPRYYQPSAPQGSFQQAPNAMPYQMPLTNVQSAGSQPTQNQTYTGVNPQAYTAAQVNDQPKVPEEHSSVNQVQQPPTDSSGDNNP